VVYVADYEQRALSPLTDGAGEAVDGTAAGEAFTTLRVVPAGGTRFWVPIVNGTERLGVVYASGATMD
jgi:phosphoserine phosphatase RsbU/P